MEKIKSYVNGLIYYAKLNSSEAEEYCNQAYGAIMYHNELYPKDFAELYKFWNSKKEEFKKIINDYYN